MESQRKNRAKFQPNPGLKLMDQVREVLRYHHHAYRTEQTYCQWILRYIYHFGGKIHPNLLGGKDIERFLSHPATEGRVSASTQRQAMNALIFLYRDVLDKALTEEIAPIRSKRQQRPPAVLIQSEVQRLLAVITGKHALMAKLLYGSGLRHHVLESGLQKAVKRGEYPGAPGTPRPCRRQDHRDLYPCHGQIRKLEIPLDRC